MKYHTLLLAVLFLAIGSCASKKGLSGPEQRKKVNDYRQNRLEKKSIDGFWQEYSRTVIERRMAERAIQFTDTLKIVFRDDSTSRFYDTFGRISSGKFYYKNGLYHLGNGQSFESIEKLGDTIKLSNNNEFSYLRKVKGFYTTPVGPERIDPDETKIGVLDALFLQGKWSVYKKEDDQFNRQKSYLKSFDIGDSNADGTFALIARFHNAQLQTRDSGFLEIEGSNFNMELKKQNQEYTILKASGTEIILEKDDVKYYLKNLSK